jgi:hypothetical protein
MPCSKDHTDVPKYKLDALPESQAMKGRHRCTSCAYELGMADGAKMESNLRQRVKVLQDRVDTLEALLIKNGIAVPK